MTTIQSHRVYYLHVALGLLLEQTRGGMPPRIIQEAEHKYQATAGINTCIPAATGCTIETTVILDRRCSYSASLSIRPVAEVKTSKP